MTLTAINVYPQIPSEITFTASSITSTNTIRTFYLSQQTFPHSSQRSFAIKLSLRLKSFSYSEKTWNLRRWLFIRTILPRNWRVTSTVTVSVRHAHSICDRRVAFGTINKCSSVAEVSSVRSTIAAPFDYGNAKRSQWSTTVLTLVAGDS